MQKILVVDDDPDILAVTELILSRSGFLITTEQDGGKVLERIETFEPNLVLLDVNLSPYDGRLICKDLKREYTIPVILFSANINVQKDYKQYNADDFIGKPFEISELVEKVKSFLI